MFRACFDTACRGSGNCWIGSTWIRRCPRGNVADDAMVTGLVGLFGIAVVMTIRCANKFTAVRAGALRYGC